MRKWYKDRALSACGAIFRSGPQPSKWPHCQCPHKDLPKELRDYVFDWSDLNSTAGKDMQAFTLAYGGMYNGDNPANMRYEAMTNGAQLLLRFVAVRQINAGEELTANYLQTTALQERT